MRRSLARIIVLLLASLAWAQDAKAIFEKAKVGQWVHYRMPNGMEMKQSVARVEGRRVTIRIDMWTADKKFPAMESAVDLDKKTDAAPDKKPAEVKTEEIEVTGHRFSCRVQTTGNVKTWISDEVPITGIVKQETDSKSSMELVGYGDAPGESKLKK